MNPAPDRATVAAWLADADCLATGPVITAAIEALATRITSDLGSDFPVVLCVARGGIVFAGHLLPRLAFPLDFDYVHVTRYGAATQGGELAWRVLPSVQLAGRHVLLVDDILDVGATLLALADWCLGAGALSVRTAVLVDKQHGRKAREGLVADYAALSLPDRFLFGFGMDLHGYWRNAPGIFALPGDGRDGTAG